MREQCFGCRASAVKRGDNATPQSIEEGEDTMNNLAFEEDRLSEKELFAMMLYGIISIYLHSVCTGTDAINQRNQPTQYRVIRTNGYNIDDPIKNHPYTFSVCFPMVSYVEKHTKYRM